MAGWYNAGVAPNNDTNYVQKLIACVCVSVTEELYSLSERRIIWTKG